MSDVGRPLALPMVRRGIAWPTSVDSRGSIAITSDLDGLSTSIWLILSTQPGERLMRPDFGCRLPHRLRKIEVDTLRRAEQAYNDARHEGAADDVAMDRAVQVLGTVHPEELATAASEVREAIARWEPRADVDDVNVEAPIDVREVEWAIELDGTWASSFHLHPRTDIRVHYADRTTKRRHTTAYTTEFGMWPGVRTTLTHTPDHAPEHESQFILYDRSDRRGETP